MRFYRGIAVAENQRQSVIDTITHEGLKDDESGCWKFGMLDLRDRLSELVDSPDLSLEHTRPYVLKETTHGHAREYIDDYFVICATGDENGASYYAQRHNLSKDHNAPIIICFDADISGVTIDGRDFLYNAVFQRDAHPLRREVAVTIFGEGVLKYLDKAWMSEDGEYRVAMCDLATQDPIVIQDHYKNQAVIEGRYGVQFCSAFMVKLPIGPDQIVAINEPNYQFLPPAYTFREIFSLD